MSEATTWRYEVESKVHTCKKSRESVPVIAEVRARQVA